VFADFNTASPSVKAELAADAANAGVLFADVAVLAPVPRAGSGTPLMASGSGAEELHRALTPLNVPIESIDGEAGAAAGRKLLRSVFMKGLAGVVLEAAEAGRQSGNEDWIKGQMAAELGPDGAELVDRLIAGSHAHAERRQHEIQDALEYVTQLGTPAWMSAGALQWLSSLAAQKTN
jgi:3-hydroxyisobutyrate dehydrogenase-like beta-hydroxyacid dehydrogenase